MKIKKAVIPVAGMGTRFLPITKAIAKEMLPIIDIPSIHYIVKECMDSGIEEIIFITTSRKPEIENYFKHNDYIESRISDNKKELLKGINEIIEKIKFTYCYQNDATGSASAISLAEKYIEDDYFAVLYGDDLMDAKIPALKQIIKTHEEKNCNVIGCMEVEKEKLSNYGICKLDQGKIVKIVEKPSLDEAPSNLAGLGRYIVNKKIFSIIKNLKPTKNNEYQFTDAMEQLMQEQDFYPTLIDGKYYDIGSKSGYLKANIDFAKKRKDI